VRVTFNSKGVKESRGQALVEFALVVPLLALLLFAIIQYGFIFNAYMTVRHGAHVTARTLALAGAITNNAPAIARQAIQPTLDPANLTSVIVQTRTIVSPNDAYYVRLEYRFPLYLRFVVPGTTNNTLMIRAAALYRRS